MILIYAIFVFLLGACAALARMRQRSLERKFIRAAQTATRTAKELTFRGGNCNEVHDSLKAAKRQFELGRLVQIRDRLEEKNHAWERRSETCGRIKRALLTYKGRFAPYAFGVVDLVGVFALLAMSKIVEPNHLQIALQSARMLVLK
ncbi:MAG: hypothetical protein K8T89_05315 [Planctomycetes bacterium]|nr:hypothetical protein [Planctomycetota bacterium]